MKQLRIIKGNEYGIKGKYEENDIFYEQYKRAADLLEIIVSSAKDENNQGLNVISFIGNRGQGKSNTMRTFTNAIADENTNIAFGTVTRQSDFYVLPTIDPSSFEEHNDVLYIVIARLYTAFYEDFKKNPNSIDDNQLNKIMALFEKVYESLYFLKNAQEVQKINAGYEESIDKINRVNDGVQLATNLKILIDLFLKIKFPNSQKRFLVIPIDDLDLYIKKTHYLADEIQKYLSIPNVVIVMAMKMDQFKLCTDMHFYSELKFIMDKDFWENFWKDAEENSEHYHKKMSQKYIDKFLPETRRIYLPEVRNLAQDYGDEFEIIFEDMSGEIIKNYTNIENTIIGLTKEKTGISFVSKKDITHPIVPKTLRELIDILTLLNDMTELTSSEEDDNDKINEIREIQKSNIEIFENYFIQSWIPNNIEQYKYQCILYTILKIDNEATINKQICIKLMEIVERHSEYTLLQKTESVISNIKNKFKSEFSGYGVGDVLTLCRVLTNIYSSDEISVFVFAIKAAYSIMLHKLFINTINEDAGRERVFKLINSNLFGKDYYTSENSKEIFSTISSQLIRGDRSDFIFDLQALLNIEEKEKLVSDDNKISYSTLSDPQMMGLLKYSMFIYSGDSITNEMISYNGVLNKAKTTHFSVETYFLNLFYPENIKNKLSVFYQLTDKNYENMIKVHVDNIKKTINLKKLLSIVLNMEEIERLLKVIFDSKNRRSTGTGDTEYYSNMLDAIQNHFEILQIEPKISRYIETVSGHMTICKKYDIKQISENKENTKKYLNDILNVSSKNAASNKIWKSRLEDIRTNLEKITDSSMEEYVGKLIKDIDDQLQKLSKLGGKLSEKEYKEMSEFQKSLRDGCQAQIDKLELGQ